MMMCELGERKDGEIIPFDGVGGWQFVVLDLLHIEHVRRDMIEGAKLLHHWM